MLLPTVALTIAALEMNMINALMFTQTVQHKILVAVFSNVAKDSEQTHLLTYNLECKIRVKRGCCFIFSNVCVGCLKPSLDLMLRKTKSAYYEDKSLLISQILCSSR